MEGHKVESQQAQLFLIMSTIDILPRDRIFCTLCDATPILYVSCSRFVMGKIRVESKWAMLTSRREIRSAKGPNCPKRPKWEIPSHWRRWKVPFQWDFQFQHRTIRFAIRPWVARLQDGCRLIDGGVDGVARTSQLMNRELCSPNSWKSIKGPERLNVSALLLPVPASHVTNKGLFSARYSQRNLQVNKFHPILTQHLHLEPNANNSGPTEYIPTCRLNLLDRVPPSDKFNSSTWTVEDKCGLRGYGQRPKKKGKAKLQQHTSAEPSLVGSCRKSARHPVIAQNAIALLQKSYVCLREVCWCQAFAVSTGHIGSTDYGTAVPTAALLNFGPSQTSRPFFGGYRGIGLCFFFTKTHSLYNFLISIPNMASPNSPPENGASETEPPRNENSSSSSSSPLPSASVGENLAQVSDLSHDI